MDWNVCYGRNGTLDGQAACLGQSIAKLLSEASDTAYKAGLVEGIEP
jgi:hypothetical protein